MVDLRKLNSDAWLARASNAELNEYADALAPILGRKRGGIPRHEVERLPEILAEARAAAWAKLERRRKLRACGLRHLAVLANSEDAASPHNQ